MSLITRCPACGTMFKVVTDQLKVSQGWVRCGHCSEVFDASLHLQAAQAPAVPVRANPEPPASPVHQPSVPAVSTEPAQSGQDGAWSPGVFFVGQSPVLPAGSAPGSDVRPDAARSDFDPADWKQQQVPRLDETGTLRLNDQGEAVRIMPAQPAAAEDVTAQPKILRADTSVSEPVQDAPDEAVKEAIDVSFVRDARRQAWWRKPLVRGVLVLFSLLLAALLLLQVLVQQRDSVAAQEPELKPWLQMLCGYLHCEVGPMRRIEALVIDSSAFNKLDNDSYRLSFSLKNTGATPVAMPALEVTLTDTQEQALIRRVLTPAQFGAANMMLVAGADFSGSVVMQVLAPDAPGAARSAVSAPFPVAAGPLRVAGYRVLAFYP